MPLLLIGERERVSEKCDRQKEKEGTKKCLFADGHNTAHATATSGDKKKPSNQSIPERTIRKCLVVVVRECSRVANKKILFSLAHRAIYFVNVFDKQQRNIHGRHTDWYHRNMMHNDVIFTIITVSSVLSVANVRTHPFTFSHTPVLLCRCRRCVAKNRGSKTPMVRDCYVHLNIVRALPLPVHFTLISALLCI